MALIDTSVRHTGDEIFCPTLFKCVSLSIRSWLLILFRIVTVLCMCPALCRINRLIFAGDGRDFLLSYIRDGGLFVHMKLGTGAFEADLKVLHLNAATRFDDNLWHRLAISREAREVGVTCFYVQFRAHLTKLYHNNCYQYICGNFF